MSASTRFCVIYQFRVRPGMEGTFKQGWIRLTEAIRAKRGGLGSRLHLSEDGIWVAYAQWPDRETWERSRKESAADPEAMDMMISAVEHRLPPLLLEPQVDLLLGCLGAPGVQAPA
jgi:quinol monooxygenase YgiN